ncbi:duf1168 domain containing protein [Grosmannia clavigera kw1407]|uniref:Duf1168 domain containing protein n=1 Tax=Grosmannia clavigera (strain kw1407 / UAMH 11150) TaxID=655863 RepID=F0XU01_GROCL|nr:duf1168 domain containing protein [Grosmannia clavigera kw1407]EFW98881.1 duf1168 domain containing protein [Grosmannia clavigera kw1407]
MSGDGPESIPTSADRRSKRPVKKRALTPVSAQAATVDALFAKPDQEIRIPALTITGDGAALVARRAAAPPEIISNVQGSSSGAGSGEFHVYKASRRREYARLRQLDDEARHDRDKTEFESARTDREARDDDKTKRNREKREKARARKAKAKTGAGQEKDNINANRPTPPSTNSQADAKAADTEAADKETPDGKSTEAPEDPKPIPASTASIPQPLPIADGPGLLIHDDDDDD